MLKRPEPEPFTKLRSSINLPQVNLTKERTKPKLMKKKEKKDEIKNIKKKKNELMKYYI